MSQILSRLAGEVRVLECSGRFRIGEGDVALREAVRESLEAGAVKMLVDLRQVSLCDSAFLGELVGSYARAANRGGALKLLSPAPKVAESLRNAGLTRLFELFEDESEALASFGAGGSPPFSPSRPQG